MAEIKPIRVIKHEGREYVSKDDLRDLLKRITDGHEPKLVHMLAGMTVAAGQNRFPPHLVIASIVSGFFIFGAGFEPPDVPRTILPVGR